MMIIFLKLYRYILSPYIGSNCRFTPTCSVYAIEAYQTLNFFYASYLTFKRLLKCQPFCAGGLDPVPCHCEVHKKEVSHV